MPPFLSQLIRQVPVLEKEHFSSAETGTRHHVWLSDKFVIRSNQKVSSVINEAALLNSVRINLVPRVVWSGLIKRHAVMVEERLLGVPADMVWNQLSLEQQNSVVREFVSWLINLGHQTFSHFSAVQLSAPVQTWPTLLEDLFKPAIRSVTNNLKTDNTSAQRLWSELQPLIDHTNNLLATTSQSPSLVHGDPIMHNLLIANGQLSGVLDWEFSLYGDPYYDYARLLYYRDCALSYGSIPTSYHGYESAFYEAIWQDIRNRPYFNQPYFASVFPIYTAYFYVRSLAWALESNDVVRNCRELLTSWRNKKGLDD